MTIEDAIYHILRNNSGVTALVSGRIFGGILGESIRTYPAICYRPNPPRTVVRTLDGGCTLVLQHISVFSASRTFDAASDTDDAVRAALDEFRGTVSNGESPEETISIQNILMTPVSHEHQYVDKTQLHEFETEFECHFLDPQRLTP